MEGQRPKTFGSAFKQSQAGKGRHEDRLSTPQMWETNLLSICIWNM